MCSSRFQLWNAGTVGVWWFGPELWRPYKSSDRVHGFGEWRRWRDIMHSIESGTIGRSQQSGIVVRTRIGWLCWLRPIDTGAYCHTVTISQKFSWAPTYLARSMFFFTFFFNLPLLHFFFCLFYFSCVDVVLYYFFLFYCCPHKLIYCVCTVYGGHDNCTNNNFVIGSIVFGSQKKTGPLLSVSCWEKVARRLSTMLHLPSTSRKGNILLFSRWQNLLQIRLLQVFNCSYSYNLLVFLFWCEERDTKRNKTARIYTLKRKTKLFSVEYIVCKICIVNYENGQHFLILVWVWITWILSWYDVKICYFCVRFCVYLPRC